MLSNNLAGINSLKHGNMESGGGKLKIKKNRLKSQSSSNHLGMHQHQQQPQHYNPYQDQYNPLRVSISRVADSRPEEGMQEQQQQQEEQEEKEKEEEAAAMQRPWQWQCPYR